MKRLIIISCLLASMVFTPQCILANPIKEKYTQGITAFQAQEYEKAIQLFEETLKMYPDFAQPYNFIAMAKKEQGANKDEIISLLKKSLSIDPDFAMAHDNLGKMYYGLGDFEKAKEHAQRAVELDPDMVTARMSLAWVCLLGLGETREAIHQFEVALEQHKSDYGLFGLGMAYFMDHQRGRVLEMITSLRLEGKDQLATDLEEMVREGRYLPPKGAQSLVGSKAEKAPTVQEKPPIPNVHYPVRLSGNLSSSSTPVVSMPTQNHYQQPASGAERIRQLQRNYQQSNYQQQGSGY